MDVGTTNGWRLDDVVPAAEIVERIAAEFPLEPIDPGYRGEVAERWRYRDGGGEIGVISSVTQPFCGDCTRARLSAEGRLYTCLFGVRGHDLRALRPRRRLRRRAARRGRRRSGARAPTATRSSAPRRPRACPRSRCATSAARRGSPGRRVESTTRVGLHRSSLHDSPPAARLAATLASSSRSGSAFTSSTRWHAASPTTKARRRPSRTASGSSTPSGACTR